LNWQQLPEQPRLLHDSQLSPELVPQSLLLVHLRPMAALGPWQSVAPVMPP
jgi:hypothetical protein